MALEFKLPDIGEGVAEGEIVKWLVAEGDTVEEHQPVVEVMTDKATVEIPSPRAGKIAKLLAAEGDVVPVGTVLFHLELAAGAAPPPAVPAASAPKPAAANPAAAKPAAAKQPQKPAAEKSAAEKPSPAAAKPAAAPARAPAAAQPASSGGGGGGELLRFKLPDIGEGVAEGEIVKWLVAVGDQVEEHQPIVEVMTDKATVEVPAPAAGRIAAELVSAGQVVPVGTVIFELEKRGGRTAAAAPATREQAAPAARQKAAAPAREPVLAAAAPAARTAEAAPARARAGGDKVLAVPSARRVARELGIDLGQVTGSGRNGIVRRADVEAFAQGAPAAEAPPAVAAAAATAAAVALSPAQGETRVPLRGVRRKIAEAMVRSKYTAPHFTVVEELDVTELVRVRTAGKELAAEHGIKLTYMPFIMKAVASGLAKYPSLNSKLDEAAQEIVTYPGVHLGIATDTEAGLIVPVIRDVQAKGMLELAVELNDLSERTRSGKVKGEELRGSTFSITNAGNIGGTLATPIINFPDVGILGVHRIVKRPGVVETSQGDKIEVRHYMNLSISVDHRIVDGATAVRFLVHLKRLLENPGLLAL